MPVKRDVKTPAPVVVRKKIAKRTAPAAPVPPTSQRSISAKAVSPSTPAVQSEPEPILPPTQPQPFVPPPLPAAPAVTETGPSKREQGKQARRELLEVLRDHWPLAFPRDNRQVRPLAIGIHRDLAASLPGHSHRQIGAVFRLFRYLAGPAYFQALLHGGPRYDLDGNPRGEVTAEEQERAKSALAAYYARRKQWKQEKRTAHESVQPVETEGKPHD